MKREIEGHVGGTSDFFGRDYLLRSLFQGVAKGWSFGLCGGPKSGKTSVLYQLDRVSRAKWKNDPGGLRVVPVIVDLSASKWSKRVLLPEIIWTQLVETLSEPALRGGSGDLKLPRPVFNSRTELPWETLIRSCADLYRELRGGKGWCRYVLCIDNGDLLLTKRFKQILPAFLDFVNLKQEHTPVALICSGTRIFREYLFDEVGHFSKWLRPIVLSPLLEAEARSMINYWLPEASDEEASDLLSITGQHPYLLARILSEVKERNLLGNLRSAMDGALIDLELLFEAIWSEFDLGRGVTYRGSYAAPEHSLMQFLLDCGEHGTTIRDAEREIGLRPLKDYFEFLEYQCLVERTLRGNERLVRSRCSLWNEWYRDRVSM